MQNVWQECEDHGQKKWQPLLGIMCVLHCTEYQLGNKKQSGSKHCTNFKTVGDIEFNLKDDISIQSPNSVCWCHLQMVMLSSLYSEYKHQYKLSLIPK